MKKITIEQNAAIRASILEGMARAFFVSAWADAHDEAGLSFKPQTQLMDAAPNKNDPAAEHAARTLHFDLERANNNRLIGEIYRDDPAGFDPNTWGHYAAMQAMGHGVGLSDNEPCSVVVPYVEFGSHSLYKDYF